jgi:hypothetical protein
MRIRPRVGLAAVLALSTLAMVSPTVTVADAGSTNDQAGGSTNDTATATDGRGDVTVIAVVDSSFSPYHLDFRADRMPQHLDVDPSNDLPLDGSLQPHEWIEGFPAPATFTSYEPLDLTLPQTGPISDAYNADAAQWTNLPQSTATETHFRWAPGTKAVGIVDFNGRGFELPAGASHGMGSASVSAGAIHGACPECVVVLVPYGSGSNGEAASDWAYAQPWIDVVTNSFGFSAVRRDRYYNGGNAELSREASERGQTVFFSAGNGQANTFTAPNTTLLSSQEGPDWMVTVGAIDPSNNGSYTGHGKPVDIAAIGSRYPSAPSTGTSNVDSEDTFGGTSNATPVTAGTFARALYLTRIAIPGASKMQSGGIIATGTAGCGDAYPGCGMADGALTAVELREALFDTAVHTPEGFDPIGLVAGDPALPATDSDSTFMTEGHGSIFGRIVSDDAWLTETASITALAFGNRAPTGPADGEDEWFVVDSYCRQLIWGAWPDGRFTGQDIPYYIERPLLDAYYNGCDGLALARP